MLFRIQYRRSNVFVGLVGMVDLILFVGGGFTQPNSSGCFGLSAVELVAR